MVTLTDPSRLAAANKRAERKRATQGELLAANRKLVARALNQYHKHLASEAVAQGRADKPAGERRALAQEITKTRSLLLALT